MPPSAGAGPASDLVAAAAAAAACKLAHAFTERRKQTMTDAAARREFLFARTVLRG